MAAPYSFQQLLRSFSSFSLSLLKFQQWRQIMLEASYYLPTPFQQRIISTCPQCESSILQILHYFIVVKHKSMISVESHSKQIKLLNDYILALEKQVASARKENQEHTKNVSASSDDLKKMNEEINRLRNQNGQLRFNNVRQDDVIRKLAPLQREVNQGRESIQKLAVENNRLNSVLQQMQENNRALEERCRNSENELKAKMDVFVQESYRDKQEMDELKKALNEKIKQNEDITLAFNQEKKNLAARVTSLETNNAELAKVKNQTIARQSKELEDLKARYSKDMTSSSQARNSLGDQIKQLVFNSNETQAKIGSLTKELNQTKQLLENKTIESEATASKLALKVNEYDNLIKRTNEEKNNLLKNIQRLEDERKRLEAVNNACKGDISQNTKALSDALKKGEQLNIKLFEANQELSKRYDLIVQSQDEITRLNNIVKQLNKDIANRTQETKVRESYITMLKGEISTANNKIQQLEEVKSSNLNNLGQLDQTANKLRKELASAKAEIKDNERVIDDKNVLLNKRTNQIQNLELAVKDHQFTISKLSTDLENRNETINNLNIAKERLEKNLEEAKNTNELLTDVKAQLQKDLDTLKAYSSNIEKERTELSTNLSQIMKEKMGDKDLLTRQLTSRDKKILELNNKYEQLESVSNLESKNNTQAIKKLQAEKLSLSVQISEANNEVQSQKKKLEQLQANFVKTKENLESLTQENNSYRKRKEVEVEELTNQLKESQKKNDKKTAKIEELNQEIKLLEDSHTNHRKNLGDSLKEELQRQKAKFNKTILELKGQHDDLINKKNIEKEQLRQQLEKTKEQLEEKYKYSTQQWSAKEKTLNELIKRQSEEKKLLEKEVSRLNYSTITESQSKTSKELQIEALKKSIERLEMYSKEQKNAIDQLNKLLDNKSKEIETIEQSNAMLRKQVISALSHQETSRKQLIQTKSRGSVVIASSKHDMRGSNVPMGTRSQLLTKKKTIFSQKEELEPRTSINGRVLQKQLTEKMKFSLVEDLNDSNFAERFD